MNVVDVQNILNEFFQEELTHDRNRHIVFWYDESKEFIDEINNIHLENIRIWTFSEKIYLKQSMNLK